MGLMLCSLNDLKKYLRIPTSETALDDDFTLAIVDASEECEHITSRAFTYSGYANETYKGGVSEIALKNYPVDSESTFQAKDYDASGNVMIYDPTDYSVDWESGIVSLRGGIRFTHGPDSARFTYSAGYKPNGNDPADPDYKIQIPHDLSRDVRDYSALLYRHSIGRVTEKDYLDGKKDIEKGWLRHGRLGW